MIVRILSTRPLAGVKPSRLVNWYSDVQWAGDAIPTWREPRRRAFFSGFCSPAVGEALARSISTLRLPRTGPRSLTRTVAGRSSPVSFLRRTAARYRSPSVPGPRPLLSAQAHRVPAAGLVSADGRSLRPGADGARRRIHIGAHRARRPGGRWVHGSVVGGLFFAGGRLRCRRHEQRSPAFDRGS